MFTETLDRGLRGTWFPSWSADEMTIVVSCRLVAMRALLSCCSVCFMVGIDCKLADVSGSEVGPV